MQTDSVDKITKRTQRYWYEDGIWEIGFGTINLMLGLFYLLVATSDWVGPLAIVLLIMQIGVIYGAFFVINRLVKFLKAHITYPRTGYVAYRKPAAPDRLKRAIMMALVAAGIGALIGAMAAVPGAANRMPLVMAIVYAGLMIYFGYRFSLARLYLVALLIVGWGYGISHFSLTDLSSSAAFFGGTGILILLSGIVTLFLYLRRTQPAQPDLQDINL